LLTSLFAFFEGCLPTVAAKINQILVSLSAGATRRANLARESVINAAWGYINALRLVTVAGILSWMLSCLGSLLLLVLRPFLPAILRKYFLWRNWAEDRLGDFVDLVCVDRAKQSERRREVASRELQYGMQVARLAELNDEVAQIARNAAKAFRDASDWLEGKYEHLRPTPFTRVAAWSLRKARSRFSVFGSASAAGST
jgi:hypothetical protein